MSLTKMSMSGKPYTGVFVEWIEEWSQFFEPCNWRTFRVAKLELEDDRIMGGVEFTLILLGLGLRVRWNYASTETVEKIDASMAAIKEQLGLKDDAA
jgi:hypothetical protein